MYWLPSSWAIVLLLCTGCAYCRDRGPDSFRYYYNSPEWFSDVVNDYLAEKAYWSYTVHRASEYAQFQNLIGKTLHLEIGKIKESHGHNGSTECSDPEDGNCETFYVISAMQGTNACDVLRGTRFRVNRVSQSWLDVFANCGLQDFHTYQEFDDMGSVEVEVTSDLVRWYLERVVSPLQAYPFLDSVLSKQEWLDKPIMLGPMMRCRNGIFYVYTRTGDIFECTVPEDDFDESVFVTAPSLFMRCVATYESGFMCGTKRLAGRKQNDDEDTGDVCRSELSQWQKWMEYFLIKGPWVIGN